MTWYARVAWLAVAGGSLPGCGPSAIRYEDHTRTILTKTLVPTPLPPVASGPMPEVQHLAIEGRLSYGIHPGAPFAGHDSSPAHLVPAWHLTGRLTYGMAPWAEAGLAVGLAPVSGSKPLVEGLTSAHLDSTKATEAVFVLRMMGPLGSGWRLGFDLEAGGRSLPSYRVIHEDITISYRQEDEFDTWMESYGAESETARSLRDWYGLVRTGPVVGFQAANGLYLGFGGSWQSQPYFQAVRTQTWECAWYEGEDPTTGCDAPTDARMADQEVVVVPYLDLTVPVGRALVQARVFASAPWLNSRYPFSMGADLSLRRDVLAH